MTDTSTSDTEPRAEVYRTRFGVALSGSSSTGRVEYYESLSRLEDDILSAQLDILIEDRKADRNTTRRLRLWRDFLKGDEYPKITQIVAVERFEDGRWLPLDFEFVAPSVTVTGGGL